MHAQDRGRGRSADGQEARARVERAWGARTAHLLCILADAHASQPQPASPRPGMAAPTRFRRGDVGLVHPAASPSSGEGSEEDQVDAAPRCGARDSQPGRGQQAAAPSSRQPAPASRGVHGGRTRQLDLRQERRVAHLGPLHALAVAGDLDVCVGCLQVAPGGLSALQAGVGMQAEGWVARACCFGASSTKWMGFTKKGFLREWNTVPASSRGSIKPFVEWNA